MFQNIGKVILQSKLGLKIFKKFYFQSVELNLMHPDFDAEFINLKEICFKYTMTTVENLYFIYKATKYVIENNIPGDFVECGVWKGGNIMMIALTLMVLKNTERKIYLYDTFEGMSKPTEKDVNYDKVTADLTWEKSEREDYNEWCYSSLEEVKKNVYSTSYPQDKFVFVKGKVEDTLPNTLPENISILRLDTDWYESTFHELVHLFPLLSKSGFIVIDDYGHWQGAREAVDTYFKNNNINIFLNRLDYSARSGIK